MIKNMTKTEVMQLVYNKYEEIAIQGNYDDLKEEPFKNIINPDLPVGVKLENVITLDNGMVGFDVSGMDDAPVNNTVIGEIVPNTKSLNQYDSKRLSSPSGTTCSRCSTYNPYGEPSLDGSVYVCYSCRT